ncbi:hypothetical protein MKW92_007465, partial [Papaver armeniacum]
MGIQIDVYKEASGVIDDTVHGKEVFDEGLNHWHKEFVGEIIGQLKHRDFGGDKEVICKNWRQSYDKVQVNRNDRALEMQLEVILSLPGSCIVGYGSWMLCNYTTYIKVSTPCSVQYHIARDTLLKLVVVHVLIFTILHGFPVHRLYSKGCMVVLGWFWPELFFKLVVSPQLITIQHPRTTSNSKGSLILKGAFAVGISNIFKIIRCCYGTMESNGTSSHASFNTYWAVTYED